MPENNKTRENIGTIRKRYNIARRAGFGEQTERSPTCIMVKKFKKFNIYLREHQDICPFL
jgi:hypothetical protein